MNKLQKYIIKDKRGYDKELINPHAEDKRAVNISESTSGKYYEAWYNDKPEELIGRGRSAERLMRRLGKEGYGNIRILD